MPPSRPIAPLDERSLAWGRDEAFLLVADKDCYTLDLYRYGRFVRSYPVVFGRRSGRKLHEGDRRTPTGLYMIIGKRRHARWSRFLLLDYPTNSDRSRYRRQLAAGWVPKRGTTHVGVGGEIGIHGTDSEALNRAKVNWTFGCISMFNTDVRELYATVPTGTLVYISD